MRRIALSTQGLIGKNRFGRKTSGVLNAIEHLGYIQIDTISVIERAHHHVLWSRVPGYQQSDIENLLLSKQIFEYWSHAAAYLPMRDFRYTLPKKNAIKRGEVHWFRRPEKKLMQYILDRINAEGPLMAREFETEKKSNSPGWWDWKPAKRALEQLFMQGDLMAVRRSGFQKVYDLTERVLPPTVNTCEPGIEEYADFLVKNFLRANGFATQKSFTYLRRGVELRNAVAQAIDHGLESGTFILLNQSHSKKSERCILDAKWLNTPNANHRKPPPRLKLISPFDNAIIQRDRTRDVHDFNYQIECYTPAPKRKYGYFTLPILYRDEFVGRVDCKAHRKTGLLEIISLFIEQAPRIEKSRAMDVFIAELGLALRSFAAFNACDSIKINKVSPGNWKKPIATLFK